MEIQSQTLICTTPNPKSLHFSVQKRQNKNYHTCVFCKEIGRGVGLHSDTFFSLLFIPFFISICKFMHNIK